jgi:hypothetical protein
MLATACLLLLVWGLLYVLSKIKKLWIQHFHPLFYDPQERRRAERRRRFAEHLKAQLNLLNSREAWQDYRFAELEAEVEAEGSRSNWFSLFSAGTTQGGLRREKSLSAALKASKERLILVEGEPGSGKSVALRHVANELADRASRSRSVNCLVPLYINLKEARRATETNIDRDLIQRFAIEALRGNDRDVEEYLNEEFKKGLEAGTWLFLFDSFDELPDLLASTEADETIRKYAEAIHNFLHGMNRCRGIVASRHFRGPGGLAWSRFRIQPLSRKRRVNLIRKVNLEKSTEHRFVEWLDSTSSEFHLLINNPMFLGLLCNHIKTDHPLPHSAHAVFETYVQSRFHRDATRIQDRFGLTAEDLRTIAEQIAFCMAAKDRLGLNPPRAHLKEVMIEFSFDGARSIEPGCDALEYMKLARSETIGDVKAMQSFTFTHRRFQEYFVTCLLLREERRISGTELLLNARWRESAVVLFQTQTIEKLADLLEVIRSTLRKMILSMQSAESSSDFEWPQGAVHLCGILQDGFASRLSDLPVDIRNSVSTLVTAAFQKGRLQERKCALQVSGTIPTDALSQLMRDAFASDSRLLKDAAYSQAARISPLSKNIADGIRHTLVEMAKRGVLRRDHRAIRAYISRLDKTRELLSVVTLLEWIFPINILLHIGFLLVLYAVTTDLRANPLTALMLALVALVNLALTWWDTRMIRFLRAYSWMGL